MSEMDPSQNIMNISADLDTDSNATSLITFTSIAETLKNKENKTQSIEMMAKLQDLMYEHLIADQEELIRKRDLEKLEKKKHAVKMELECLEIENSKMDTYLKTLTKKHDLEILYLQEVCAQRQKITDLSNNHPDIDFSKIRPYGEFYREELQNVMNVKVIQPSENKSDAEPTVKINTSERRPEKNSLSPRTRTIKSGQQDNADTINIHRRNTIGGSDLQSCLRNALQTKFKNVGGTNDPDANKDDSDWDEK
jgi:hypothetical protein